MRRRSWSLVLAALACALPFTATSAPLHWPLPADSLARNGEPQRLERHKRPPKQHAMVPALPARGLHPKAALGLARVYSGAPTDVLRYHNDNYPTGWNRSETDLTPSSVASASFGQLTTLNVDGNVIAQPLMVSNFQMPDGHTHNVLIVATGHDTVYAYDAQNYAVLWQRTLGHAQSSGDIGCSDVVPEYGISSTPVIVRNGQSATIYLVAATEPAQYSFHTKIHALDLATGKDIVKPVEIAPAANLIGDGKVHFDPQNQWSRASLAYTNGSIYVGIGSHCDYNAGSISGWMMRYDTNLNLTGKFNTIEAPAGYELSSIWMAGYSPAIDPNGNVFAVTGNGNYSLKRGSRGYGESVLSLSSDLKTVMGSFTPSNFQQLNDGDVDFGSGGVMLLPQEAGQTAPPLAVAMGKANTLYLLNANNLGGLEGKTTRPLQKFNPPGGGCWCGPAYFPGPNGGIVYYESGWDVLRAFKVDAGATPRLKEIASGTSGTGYGGAFPVVSSNGTRAHSALVWVIRRGNTEAIEAYNALTLGDPLFQANAGTWSQGDAAFLTPLVANGRVYVGAYQTVTVFGLTQ
ncbi:MAG TPA: hypothetical protein VGG69_03395 [Rhizomicrobium sp.]